MVRTGNVDFSCKMLTSIEIRRIKVSYNKKSAFSVGPPLRKISGSALESHIMAVGDTNVFPGFLTPVLTQLFFPKPLIFPHASAEVRGENTPDRKFASIVDRTGNHQVMSATRSPLSHLGGALL